MTGLLSILSIQKGMKVKYLEIHKGKINDFDFFQSDKQRSGTLVLGYGRRWPDVV